MFESIIKDFINQLFFTIKPKKITINKSQTYMMYDNIRNITYVGFIVKFFFKLKKIFWVKNYTGQKFWWEYLKERKAENTLKNWFTQEVVPTLKSKLFVPWVGKSHRSPQLNFKKSISIPFSNFSWFYHVVCLHHLFRIPR